MKIFKRHSVFFLFLLININWLQVANAQSIEHVGASYSREFAASSNLSFRALDTSKLQQRPQGEFGVLRQSVERGGVVFYGMVSVGLAIPGIVSLVALLGSLGHLLNLKYSSGWGWFGVISGGITLLGGIFVLQPLFYLYATALIAVGLTSAGLGLWNIIGANSKKSVKSRVQNSLDGQFQRVHPTFSFSF